MLIGYNIRMPKSAINTRVIGNVKISLYPESSQYLYSDGDVEEKLLKLFSAKDAENKRRDLLSQRPTWPESYHLSYARENLLNWLDFTNTKTALEVGAGCGALTKVLLDNIEQVTALELSERRATILATRFQSAKNLDVVACNIMSFPLKNTFDLITSIGVTEYSPSYIDSDNPPYAYLSKLRSLLNPGGMLILAIENKLGLKYWTGAAEDHTGKIYEGIHGYPNTGDKVITFSRLELLNELNSAGYRDIEFYYPYPDYKLPSIIYSDLYYPGLNDTAFPVGLLPSPSTDRQRELFFSEAMAMNSIQSAGLFCEFSNSFLVLAYA